jgi:calcineurin-like phosphoesterase family protein
VVVENENSFTDFNYHMFNHRRSVNGTSPLLFKERRMSIFFTADHHFNHKNIIKYSNRPFKDEEEMNHNLISNWNSRIKVGDTVYHLGDVGFGNLENILKILNGEIILIRGTHDKSALEHPKRFRSIHSLLDLKIEDQDITLCHYAMRTWRKSHYGAWHLFGHSHGSLPAYGASFDVGVDCWNFYPVSFKEIKDKMDILQKSYLGAVRTG